MESECGGFLKSDSETGGAKKAGDRVDPSELEEVGGST